MSAASYLEFPTASLLLLDEAHEWSAFSRPTLQGVGCWESSLVIEGMHCTACALIVEDALRKVPGVISAHVGAASLRAKVTWSAEQTKPSDWMQAVHDSGYGCVPANDMFANERRNQETRQALWRWLVAGLCMMQVMMYAYPAYIARPPDLTAEMEQLLRWASWVLSLPVMLFSCGPFFRSAMRDLMHMRISMDLPVSLGIFITFAVSTVGTFDPNGVFGREVFFDSLTMFVFFLLTGRWLELRLRDRTAGALDSLMNRLPDSVECLNANGQFERVAARRVMVGDVLRVHPGEAFVADGLVESGDTLVNEALLTGESDPLPRGPGSTVLSGSHNLRSTVLVRVQCTGVSTRFAQIVALMESAATTKPMGVQIVDRLAKPFLIVVLLSAALACAWWWSRDPGHALMVAVAVLIVTCPCALSLATPAAILASAGTLARSGVLVRRLQALEALSLVDTFVFDKTGTLTSDSMGLGAIEVRDGMTEDMALAMARALAQHSLHPAARALQGAEKQDELQLGHWRCDAVTETVGQGLCGTLHDGLAPKNAPPQMVRLGSASFCGVTIDQSKEKGSAVFLSDSQGWLATFELIEALRPQAASSVAALQALGVSVHLLSGDTPDAAKRIASKVGITQVQGGCSPEDKLAFMGNLQAQGHIVAMVGDGLNDGPVLAAANVSFAMGQAVPLAQAQSDFVIMGEQLTGLVHALGLSRRTMGIVRQNLGWALGYNLVCVPLAVMGWMPAWLAGLGMASSSLFVVLNALRLARDADLPKDI